MLAAELLSSRAPRPPLRKTLVDANDRTPGVMAYTVSNTERFRAAGSRNTVIPRERAGVVQRYGRAIHLPSQRPGQRHIHGVDRLSRHLCRYRICRGTGPARASRRDRWRIRGSAGTAASGVMYGHPGYVARVAAQ